MENKSKEFSFQIIILSFIIYFNGFVIQILLYAEYDGKSIVTLVEGTPLENYIPYEKYETMDREWFAHIGAGIIFTTMIKIINPSTIIFTKALINK
jgi:hypothetical protein